MSVRTRRISRGSVENCSCVCVCWAPLRLTFNSDLDKLGLCDPLTSTTATHHLQVRMVRLLSGWVRWRGHDDGIKNQGVPSPLPHHSLFSFLFFWSNCFHPPIGDLGRFNHTISSLGQLNQIGQINRSSTGDAFTSPSHSWCRFSFSLCVFVPVSWLSCSLSRLSWHGGVLTKLNSRFSSCCGPSLADELRQYDFFVWQN